MSEIERRLEIIEGSLVEAGQLETKGDHRGAYNRLWTTVHGIIQYLRFTRPEDSDTPPAYRIGLRCSNHDVIGRNILDSHGQVVAIVPGDLMAQRIVALLSADDEDSTPP